MLTDKSIRYTISQIKRGRRTKVVAEELNISQRHIQRLWTEYIKTEKVHIQGHAGSPKKPAHSDKEVEMILDIHRRWPDGVQMTVKRLRRVGYDIIYCRVHAILKSHGLVSASPAKSKQRK